MKRPLLRLASLVAAFPLALAARAEAPPSTQFDGALDVRVVNVEAVVTDGRGQRVPGLGPADFRLLVDGREVPIDYFSEIREGETVRSSAEVASGEGIRPAPAAPAPAPAGVNYLVFLDERFTIAAQRDFVLQRMLGDLSGLRAVDRMAVVAYDGKRLERLLDWTAERSEVESAFKTAMLRPSRGLEYLAERRSDLGSKSPEGLEVTTDYDPVTKAVAAAGAAMRGMASPSGRKVMLILSGGWPVPNDPRQGTIGNRQFADSQMLANLDEFFKPLTEAANLLGYAVYPVDVPGTDPGTDFASATSTGPGDFTRMIGSEWDMASQAGLEQIAKETGGKAILNSARLNAFERAVADTRTYYGLGFSPAWQADGRRHDIRLEARKPGLKVRAREGFSDLARNVEVALRNESLLFFGGSEGSRRLRLRAGDPVRAGFGKVRVPIAVELPVATLTSFPSAGGTSLQGILSMEALDRYGKRTDLGMIQLRLAGSRDPGEADVARYETEVTLPRGEQHLVFIVRDDAGEGEAWGALDVEARARR